MSLIKLSLDGNNLIIPVLGELGNCVVSDIPVGDAKTFFTVYALAKLQTEKKEKDNEVGHAGWGT
jgi:hypothetical protein